MLNHDRAQKSQDSRPTSSSDKTPAPPASTTDVMRLPEHFERGSLTPPTILRLQKTIGNQAVMRLLAKTAPVQKRVIQAKRWVFIDGTLEDPDTGAPYAGSDAPTGLNEGDVFDDSTKIVTSAQSRMNSIFAGTSTSAPTLNLPDEQEFNQKLRALGRKDAPETKPEPPEMSYDWLIKRGLTQGEISALQQYTTALYHLANKFLRGQITDKFVFDQIGRLMEGTSVADAKFNQLVEDAGFEYSEKTKAKWLKVFNRYLELIVSGMQKLPTPKHTVVSRGVNLETQPEFFEKHKQDQVITDPGFMSTAFGTPFAKDSIIIINLPPDHPGRDISKLSAFEQESEILFPPGTGYKIDRIIPRTDKDFAPALDKLVSDKTDLQVRFSKVNRIIETTLTLPKM